MRGVTDSAIADIFDYIQRVCLLLCFRIGTCPSLYLVTFYECQRNRHIFLIDLNCYVLFALYIRLYVQFILSSYFQYPSAEVLIIGVLYELRFPTAVSACMISTVAERMLQALFVTLPITKQNPSLSRDSLVSCFPDLLKGILYLTFYRAQTGSLC